MRQALLAVILLAAAGPAFAADERRWNFREDEEGLSLSWAIPQSDDPGPFFYCQRGEGKVGVVMFVERRIAVSGPNAAGQSFDAEGRPDPWPTVMTLTSGNLTDLAPGGAVNDEQYGSLIEAKLDPDAPILLAFARTGAIRLTAYGETIRMPKAPVERVRALLAGCRK